MGTRRILSLVLLAASASACSHGIRVETHRGPELAAQVAAIFPVQFRWEQPDYRAWELASVMATEAILSDRYAVFGPGEFKLVRASSKDPFVGSDLSLGLADRGLSPLTAVVFHPWIEKRAQSALKQVYDSQGRPRGFERLEQATLIAHLEVFHSGTREVLTELEKEIEIDPLATHEASDPQPELTEALRNMMRSALSELKDRAPGEAIHRGVGIKYLWNPKGVLDFAQDEHAPLKDDLAKLDALEQDVVLEARLRFFYPDADDPTIARLKRSEAGLLVLKAEREALEAGIKPGDLIVAIGREPALPQVLHRAMRSTPKGGRLEVQVRRGAELVPVALEVR